MDFKGDPAVHQLDGMLCCSGLDSFYLNNSFLGLGEWASEGRSRNGAGEGHFLCKRELPWHMFEIVFRYVHAWKLLLVQKDVEGGQLLCRRGLSQQVFYN